MKPSTPSSFLAFCTATVQLLMFAYFFLPAALAFLLTILPDLFLIRSDFIRPVFVFSLEPEKTTALMCLPFAIFDTFLAFITFIAFIAFIAAIFFSVNVFETKAGKLKEY